MLVAGALLGVRRERTWLSGRGDKGIEQKGLVLKE